MINITPIWKTGHIILDASNRKNSSNYSLTEYNVYKSCLENYQLCIVLNTSTCTGSENPSTCENTTYFDCTNNALTRCWHEEF